MSVMGFRKYKCAVCGAEEIYITPKSIHVSEENMDLDSRTDDMKDGAMSRWIQECSECGYISRDITNKSVVTREWLQSDWYRSCDGIEFASGLAGKFYKQYRINLEEKDTEGAFYSILHAAWACDDEKDDANAKLCRKLGISLATTLIAENRENKEEIMFIRADMMRRAGQFDEMIEKYGSVDFDDEILNQILEFELNRAKDKDMACYSLEDVVGTV